jgi:small subunit ribosomal protein S18
MAYKKRQEIEYFDYKDFKTLQRFITPLGAIQPRKKTSLSEARQRQLATAIKKARHIALLPFVVN